jgi:uncharacterized protein YjiS (DUF1127 family)
MPLIITPLAQDVASLAAAARRWLAAIHFWHRARRDYRILCEADDNVLRDLGLTRSDLWHATRRCCLDDPTSIVAVRAAERTAPRDQAEASR